PTTSPPRKIPPILCSCTARRASSIELTPTVNSWAIRSRWVSSSSGEWQASAGIVGAGPSLPALALEGVVASAGAGPGLSVGAGGLVGAAADEGERDGQDGRRQCGPAGRGHA